MAERTLFHLAGKVIEGLASLAIQEVGLGWGFKKEIKKLTKTASFIQAGLLDAEEQQHNNNNRQLTLWLTEIKYVLYDVEDLLDDLSTEALRWKIMAGNAMVKEVRLFFSKSNKLSYSLKMGHRVKAIRERLDALAADRANFQLSDRPVEPPIQLKERDQTHSFVLAKDIIGRDGDKNKILELLLESYPEQNVSVVPIVGIGGLGKTTLAKMVFNDEKVNECFELKMWVTVSEKFEVKAIVDKIIEAATRSKPERDLQMQTLQILLRERINGKKYLLVLDDVWNEYPETWHDLRDLLSGGARGSWIVLTTRSGLVAKITGTITPHILEGLSEAESWSLLQQVAFEEQIHEPKNSRLEAVGMEIVKTCNGVPLAIRAIGSVLLPKRTEAEWEKVKNNVLKYITQEQNSILPILKLSYDHLPLHLRQCFAYCSLIPKDTKFKVKTLITLWMAQGRILPLSGDEDWEDVGYEYFKDLLQRSFFQVEEIDHVGNVKKFTMHDLMHDLACSVAGTECCIVNNLEANNVDERTRHVSFEEFLLSFPITLLKAKRLRTFIQLQGGIWAFDCNALFSSLKYLRLLDLSGLNIRRLPHSIGKLKHLRALDLSRNYFKELPDSLCMLHNLQTLNLNGCRRLRKLPRKIIKLVSLKCLFLKHCSNLAYMPCGIGQLTCLRTLNYFVVGKPNRQVGQLRELNGLMLEGKLHISFLKNAIPEVGSTYLKDKLNLKSLQLTWGRAANEYEEVDEVIFDCLNPHSNLEELEVGQYSGSKFSSWLSSLTNLTKLILWNCVKCKHLPPLHQLSSLKALMLLKLEALQYISDIEMQEELSSAKSTTVFLPSLEIVTFRECPNLEGWWKNTDVGDQALSAQLPCFPNCLSELKIRFCPNLTFMPRFPSIKELELIKSSWKPVQETMKLKNMAPSGLAPSAASSSSSSSPLSPFSKLQKLVLEDIEDLLEELVQNLTSLRHLIICNCSNMTSIPEGMQLLTSLEKLEIINCPQLTERCERDTGVDWPNIAHINCIEIDKVPIQWNNEPVLNATRNLAYLF